MNKFEIEKHQPNWETIYADNTCKLGRFKVDGGYLYNNVSAVLEDKVFIKCIAESMCFVPEVDLTRYQSHLRDAYNKGFQDGIEEGKSQFRAGMIAHDFDLPKESDDKWQNIGVSFPGIEKKIIFLDPQGDYRVGHAVEVKKEKNGTAVIYFVSENVCYPPSFWKYDLR